MTTHDTPPPFTPDPAAKSNQALSEFRRLVKAYHETTEPLVQNMILENLALRGQKAVEEEFTLKLLLQLIRDAEVWEQFIQHLDAPSRKEEN